MSYANARNAYMTASVQTVAPGQLLVMLYDALLRNLDLADAALERGDIAATHTGLVKAQDIVTELHVSLDLEQWPGGLGLQQLYVFVGNELVEANLTKDAAKIRSCRALIAPLADAWRQAAGAGGTTATAAPITSSVGMAV